MAVDGPDSALDTGSGSDVSDDRGGSSVSDSDRSDFSDARAEASGDSGGSDGDDDGPSGPSSGPDMSGDDGAADRAASEAAAEDSAAAEDAARAAAEDAVAEDAVVEDTMQREIDARRSMAESLAEAGVDLSGRPISDSAVAAARASRGQTASAEPASIDPTVDPSVDPLDDPDTIDRAVNGLDPGAFAATPEARADAANIIAERSTEYVAGISGFTDVEIDERGIADDLVTIARSDPERAAGIAEALATQLSPLEAEIVDHRATQAMENARLAEFKLNTRPFGAPTGEVAPGDARQAAEDLLAGATGTGLFGGTRIDAEGLAEGLVGIRDADPDLAVEAYRAMARTLDPADAARLDRELGRQPYAPGVSVLSAYERRATDIPIVSDIVGDTLAGVQGLWRGVTGGPDYAVNPLTGRVLTGRDLQDAKFGAFIELATLGLGKAVTSGARVVDDAVDGIEGARLGGVPYGEHNLEMLDAYLERRGVTLRVGDEHLPPFKAGGFDAERGEILLRDNPTQYEVWHELSHYLQFRALGREAYLAQPRTPQNMAEQFVFDMLENSPRRWGRLSDNEREHAVDYIYSKGGIR